jgi:tetratricopeptide (TPR) repeat protein
MRKINLLLATISAIVIASNIKLSAESVNSQAPNSREKTSTKQIAPNPVWIGGGLLILGVGFCGINYFCRTRRRPIRFGVASTISATASQAQRAEFDRRHREEYQPVQDPDCQSVEEITSTSMANPVSNLAVDSNDRPANPPPSEVKGTSTDKHQTLIDRLIDMILKGQIRCQEQIYQILIADVEVGMGEIFERCLSNHLSSIQSHLTSLKNSGQLFQSENPELKQARLQREQSALQDIDKQWKRWQQYNQAGEAIATAVQQIINAPTGDRFIAFLRAIDPNQQQAFSFSQLQQLAQALKSAGECSDDEELNREIQPLATGINHGLTSCRQLEGHLVRWIYEASSQQELKTRDFKPADRKKQSSFGFRLEDDSQEESESDSYSTEQNSEAISQQVLEPSDPHSAGRDPWAMWAKQLTSPLPQQLFATLAVDGSIDKMVSHHLNVGLSPWVELAVVLQCLQSSLVAWFEQQLYDALWATTASSATFLTMASILCQLSNACQQAVSIDTKQRELLAKGCFQIALQGLRMFARKSYFPLYGGVFALFGDNYLRFAIDYLDAPLRQAEGTQEKARILTLLGYSQRILGQYESARSFHQEALEIAQQDSDRPCEIANFNHLSRIEVAQKNYDRAINYSQRALILAREAGDSLGEANALATLGYGEVLSAQQLERIEPEVYERVIIYLQQGLNLSEKLGDSQSQVQCSNSLGIAHVIAGYPQAALPELKKGEKAVQLLGDRYLQGLNFVYQAEAYYSLQDQKGAIYYACLGMYILEQIAAREWQQSADLLIILQGQVGVETFQQLLAQLRAEIISVIGVDGYDHFPHLIEENRGSTL